MKAACEGLPALCDPSENEVVELEILREFPGRAVLAEDDGTIYFGRNYGIFATHDEGQTLAAVGDLPRSPWRRLLEGSRLACRLLRQEVRALVRLSNGTFVAANREGVFFSSGDGSEFTPSVLEETRGPARPPMRLTVGPDDLVLWGEYTSKRSGCPIRIYASTDAGRVFEVVHTCGPGEVLHIHSIEYDALFDHYWVLAGDHGQEPGIGRLSKDLRAFDWLVKGKQCYRAVVVFDFGDHFIYATDSELELNALISLDKRTGKTERLREFDGSCIYGCRFGDLYALTTTVEPSRVNRSPYASLWLSRDGIRWKRAWSARKDRWNADLFQFGSVVLPTGGTPRETIVFSGQALQQMDGRTAVARLAPGTEL